MDPVLAGSEHISHESTVGTYATLGVPEIWRYADGKMELQCLTEGTYRMVDTSQVLSGIHDNLLTRFIDEARTATNQTRGFKDVVAVVSAQS